MVLALSYLKKTGQASPGTSAQFLEKIDQGYQRLLAFEVKEEPGGFDWWGKAPANLFLTAYALVGFRDLSEVHEVDPALLGRIAGWLLAKQAGDGSWNPEGEKTGWSTDMAKGKSFFLTAYVAWGLARAGRSSGKALAWLEANAAEATDPYGLALAALAFLTADPASAVGHDLAARLALLASADEAGPSWTAEGETGVGGRGVSAAIETTALAVQALLLDGRHLGLAYRALDRLALWRGKDGRFGTTQSTILALQALLAADPGGGTRTPRTVRVRSGRAPARELEIPAGSTEPQVLDLPGDDPALAELDGEGRVRVTLARTAWLPWKTLPERKGGLRLLVRYPEGALAVGRRAVAEVVVQNDGPRRASVVTLEIGIPPGCDVEPGDVRGEGAENVERGETAIVIYLRALDPGQQRAFAVPFTPRYALDVKTAPSKAYEYYVPEEEVVVPPARVRAGALREPSDVR